ncbi:hypothetical protein L1856_34570 [Streptomyces sp. Tue 6430]|nr:hypothetical protein [Streptomyces sp. Tue 6430]
MNQESWRVDALPVELVHELTHQLGLRDEYREADAPTARTSPVACWVIWPRTRRTPRSPPSVCAAGTWPCWAR